MLLLSPLPRGRWTFSVRTWLGFVALLAIALSPARYFEHDRRVRQLVATRDVALGDWRQVKRALDRGVGSAEEEVRARERYFRAREIVAQAADGGDR